jgi:hypothetical protein
LSRRRPRRYAPQPFIDVTAGIDASRRVGWARFYREQEHAHTLEVQNSDFRKRQACIDDTMIPLLLELVESVLHEHHFESFGIAYRIRAVLDGYLAPN